MDRLEKLRATRAATFSKLEGVIDTAEKRNDGKGEWTGEDQEKYDKQTADLKEVDARINDIQEHEAREAELAEARRNMPAGIRPEPEQRAGSGAHRAGSWLASELRALVGSGTTGGGSYTPSEASKEFFDLLGAASVGLSAGFRTIRTAKDSLIVPRLTADVGSAWVAEGAVIPNVSLTADQITATPRKLAGIEQLSNEVINDSEPAILDVVGQSLVRSISLKLDLGLLEGSGVSPEVKGLRNTSGIQTVSSGTNGLTPANLDPFADAIGLLQSANSSATAIFMSPRTFRTLLKVKETSTGTKPLLQAEQGGATAPVRPTIYGVPVYLSSQLSVTETQGTATNASSAYVVQADQCIVVMRQDVRVERDSSRLFNSDQSEVRAIARADLAVANPSAVVRISGILP